MQRRGWGRPQRLALASIFGVLVFISKTFIPTPLDKMLIFVQATFLPLGSLLIGPLGATWIAAVGGLLTAVWRAPLAVFSLTFALIYGLLVDGVVSAFKVMAPSGKLRARRLIFGVTVATAIVGFASYYVTVYAIELLPRNPVLEITILVAGVISGLIGGYLATLIWSKALRHLVDATHW